jgi:hypothetical protein
MARHDQYQAKTNAGGHRKEAGEIFFHPSPRAHLLRQDIILHQWPQSVFPSVGIHATIPEVGCPTPALSDDALSLSLQRLLTPVIIDTLYFRDQLFASFFSYLSLYNLLSPPYLHFNLLVFHCCHRVFQIFT